jgi:spore germination protein
MKRFEYADNKIGTSEMTITITSMIIGVGILNLPRLLARETSSSDGWISIAVAGGAALLLAWFLAKFSILFHEQGYFLFTAQIATRPVAFIATGAITLYFLMFSAYEVRAIANISKQYLFERTPVEVIALAFLLVLTYAVSGSSVGLLRLNVLFLPLVLFIALVVLSFSTSIFKLDELQPFFISDWRQIGTGAKDTIFSLLGFEVVLFYITMMKRPQGAPKAAAIGVAIPLILYLMIYLICVGVFSQPGLKEIKYPAIELAKEIQIPGEFFERFESIFFTIWIMTIFNSATMAMDICVHTLCSMFRWKKRMNWLFILAPCIYFISMISQDPIEFITFGSIISYTGIVSAIIFPILIYLISIIRGVKGNAS